MDYIFIWTKNLKETCLSLYCCKKIKHLNQTVEETKETNIAQDSAYFEEQSKPSEDEIEE